MHAIPVEEPVTVCLTAPCRSPLAWWRRVGALTWIMAVWAPLAAAQDADSLWSAARRGDLDTVKKAVGSGIDVNAKTDYGATAISFAADRGHLDVVKFLLENQADPNVKDDFYGAVPMDWASSNGHYEIMKALVGGGATKIQPALSKGVSEKDADFLRSIADNPHLTFRLVQSNLKLAKTVDFAEGVDILTPLLEKLQPPRVVPEDRAKQLVGSYLLGEATLVTIGWQEPFLTARLGRGNAFELDFLENGGFSGSGFEIEFTEEDGRINGLNWTVGGESQFLKRLTTEQAKALAEARPAVEADPASPAKFPPSSEKSRAEDRAVASPQWPQFRGNQARGIADGQHPPISWNVEEKQNVAWSVEIPGLGHSCPVIWNDRLFVTTAISEKDTELKTGLYGDVASVKDDSEHEFVTYCINKQTGKVIWQRTAIKTVPQVKRHLKSTHANSTVATDGRFVVSWFGSEGVYCYTVDGELAWKKDLGLLDSGWFYDRDYQWQFGASPIIHDGKLILLCDIQDQSFIGCYELATGQEIWRTDRDEIPSWSTPTVVETPTGKVIVTNATQAARGYDLETGEELWRIGNNSEIAVPTPFAARNLIFVASGYRPVQPIYAIRLDARGDLTLEESEKASEYVAWSDSRGGPYMPSPLVYGDYLYICSNSGILTCYQATTGEEVYKQRLRMKGIRSFVGSPVAADGYLYFTSEDGETAVVKAGPRFELVANNFSGENCLTTPAISEGRFFLRTQGHVFAFERQAEEEGAGKPGEDAPDKDEDQAQPPSREAEKGEDKG